MNKTTRVCLGFLMILVGSLVALDNAWEARERYLIKDMSTKICRHTADDFYPASFELYQEGNYTCVRIAGTSILVYHSVSSSEAVNWAMNNVPSNTGIEIMEDIIMDGYIDWGWGNKSFSLRAKGGFLIYE